MKYDKKVNTLRLTILILGVGFIIYVSYHLFFQMDAKQPSKQLETSSKLAFAKGISFVEYHGDKKVYSVSIDSFYIERARIGPFAIGPFHIAYLTKVVIELYQEGIDSKFGGGEIQPGQTQQVENKDEFLNLDQTLMDIRKKLPGGAKKVKGVEIKDVSISLWKGRERIFKISSNSASVDRKTRNIVFTGQAILEAGNNGKLISHRIQWDRKTRLFRVTDSYYLIKNDKRTEGKGIETDYLLKKISYIPSAT